MGIQLFHKALGNLKLHSLELEEHPKTPLSLISAYEGQHFLGTIQMKEFGSSRGSVLLFDYMLQPAVELKVKDELAGLKLLVVTKGACCLQAGTPETWRLSEGKLCLFESEEYLVSLPERANLQYFVFAIAPLASQMSWDGFHAGVYEHTANMVLHVNAIMKPPKAISFPEDWLFLQLLNLLAELREKTSRLSQSPDKGNKYLDFVLAADELIRKHLTRNFTTLELSRMVGLNECYLKNAFAAHFKMGMAKHQNQLRITKAKSLLQGTDKSINEIALECGYDSAGAFSKCFQSITKIPPTEWRKINKL